MHLAWAIVERENRSRCELFIHLLTMAVSNYIQMTLISHCYRCVLAADEILGNTVKSMIGCFH